MSDFDLENYPEVKSLYDSLSAAGHIAYVWDFSTDTILWLGNIARFLSLPPRHGCDKGKVFEQYISDKDVPMRRELLRRHLEELKAGNADPHCYDFEYRVECGNGRSLWIEERGMAAVEIDGHITLRGTLRTVNHDAYNKDFLERLAYYDDLTGYFNRPSLVKLLNDTLAEARPERQHGYFLAIGIDRLSFFNEAFGSDIADAIITGVGHRLDYLIGVQGTIGRISGDVYGVVLPDIPEEDVTNMATKALSSLCTTPLVTPAGPVRVSVSMGGVSFSGEEKETAAEIITKAESALSMAKKEGRGCFMPYRLSEKERAVFRAWLKTGDDFLAALDDDRLVLAFQPVVDSKTQEVRFHECLVRLVNSDGSLVNAQDFIPAVEELGLSRLVDQYTIKLALEELDKYPDLSLSVNVSAWTLTDPCWIRRLISLLKDRAHLAHRLIIEITETLAMKDVGRTRQFIKTLQEIGCRVALDDFGAGHTSFSQIRNLGVDIVKIDKSFVRGVQEHEEMEVFIQAMQDLAESFDFLTVGEGAETAREAAMLRDHGISFIQGFLFGRPTVERVWLPKGHAQRIPDALTTHGISTVH